MTFSRTIWTYATTVCLLVGSAGSAWAQQSATGSRSTLEGVYTEAQAERGRDLYAGMCRSCHTVATHTPTFKVSWSGRPLSELFEYISQNMPQNSPGALSPDEYTSVLAYMLRMLGMPAGQTDLPNEATLLAAIRFDTLNTSSARPAH